MKLLFFGDSITDASRRKERGIMHQTYYDYGCGYVRSIAMELAKNTEAKYEIINRGLSGNILVDLYARVKPDVWDENPDVLTILIGINDVWRYIGEDFNPIYLEHFETLYRLMINQTKQLLPNAKIILAEPFVSEGIVTCNTPELPDKFQRFCRVYKYAKAIQQIAEETNSFFLPLQEKFSTAAKQSNASFYTDDGVHPHVLGAELIANEWLKLFKEKVENA